MENEQIIQNFDSNKEQEKKVESLPKIPIVPIIKFKEPNKEIAKIPDEQEKPKSQVNAGNLVEKAFEQAVVHQVSTDTQVQEKLLDGAKKVIENKVDALKTQAETESKTANFNNKKGACECFGYNENTTEKWAVNVMNFWHNFMTAIWIIIGSVTFAPITFVAKKIKVILKASWVSILFAVLIYFIITTGPIWWQYFWDWILSLVKQ